MLLLLLLPNWLSDSFSELAIGKLERRSSCKRVEANVQPFAQEQKIGNNLHRREERVKFGPKSEKARTDFVPALPGSLAGSCLGLLEGGPSNCGREEGEAMEAREAKEAIVEAGTTTNNQRLKQEGKVYFGGNWGSQKNFNMGMAGEAKTGIHQGLTNH